MPNFYYVRSVSYNCKSSLNLQAQKLLIKWWWNWPMEGEGNICERALWKREEDSSITVSYILAKEIKIFFFFCFDRKCFLIGNVSCQKKCFFNPLPSPPLCGSGGGPTLYTVYSKVCSVFCTSGKKINQKTISQLAFQYMLGSLYGIPTRLVN